MPEHRMTMHKAREILRLKWGQGLSNRQVGRSVKASPATVSSCLLRAKAAGLSWPLPEAVDDAALEALLYPRKGSRKGRPQPDLKHIYRELKRKGVTIELQWMEYKATHPERGYQYSQFCKLYRGWRKTLDVVMRQDHPAGKRLYVDYAGQTMELVDPETGEVSEAQVFVATLGASSYTYAEAQPSQELRHWIAGHIRAFEFFKGCTEITVPDNLKSGVTRACYYEPGINKTYEEMADYYGTVVIPARKRKPRDKAKVENGVLQVERWMLAPLRDQTFFSLGELNRALARQLAWLNDRPLSKLDGTRRSLYEELDRPALLPLPARRFVIPEWKTDVGVNIDYHAEFAHHHYSVPYVLACKRVDIRATATTVELLFKGNRVASHRRSYVRGGYTTAPEHRPKHHQAQQWPPSRLIRWATTIGPHTAKVVETILARKKHPEQGHKACLGVMRLGKQNGQQRLERACQRACAVNAFSYQSIKSILKNGLEEQPLPGATHEQLALDLEHDNIRGGGYYN
ncbi:MAG: IS21 family transposase [Mariprofundaceae bacterium]|nr:IS21 family transposase [Mariprofundaceae bacterium]